MITADAQQLEPGGRITVYELDASSFGADQLFFHQHLQTGVIWWQGQEYGAWPIEATGFARTSGQQPTPQLKVSDIDGRIGAMCQIYDDMVGARIIRRRTLVKYLDAANFPPIVNLLNNSNNPASLWTNVGSVGGLAGAPLHADGISFIAPFTVASAGAVWHRRQAPLRTAVLAQAGQQRTVTTYFRFGTSGSVRVVHNNNVNGNKESLVTVGVNSQWPTVTAVPAGPVDILEYRDVGNGVKKLVTRITYIESSTASIQFGFGPNTAVNGGDATVLGMQVEDGDAATLFQATTNNPVYDRQPNADPNEHFVDEIWFIDRKVAHVPGRYVEFELATAMDLNGEVLPGRQIMANVCTWLLRGGYRGPYCGYTGAAYFDINDNPVDDPGKDVCAGLLRSCKRRFGENNALPYGGFPAAGLIRT